MLRASAICEEAGFPTASLTCEGFMGQFAATAVGLGMPGIPCAMVPGHPGTQSPEELRRNILEVTVERVVANLTAPLAAQTALAPEPDPRQIVASGDYHTINELFIENEWSDGLPIVPPTRERVDEFLAFTDRRPDDVIGVILPDQRAATVWSIAVNGVMAGCRPEYMPILVALVEAMVDPEYTVEHSGNTPGGETLLILNGPIVKELGVNFQQGVMRDGFRPNTTIGRFWRLYLRNVAGFLLHQTDKATYGNTWRVLIAENEDALAKIGWEPNSVEMGYDAGDNTVTIARYTGGNFFASVIGSTPEQMLPYVAHVVKQQISWQLTFTVGLSYGKLRPLLLVTPIIAETIARAGWSKLDVKRYLYEHTRMPAWEFERLLRDWFGRAIWDLAEEARLGRIPKVFHESDDPNRLVPIVWEPEDFMIVVTGDPLRNNAYAFAPNGSLGYPVARRIALPRDWARKLAQSRGR